jgi:hypothetical protein
MLRSRRIQTIVVIALLAVPLFMFGDRALAIQDSEDKVWFGPVGLGVGQGARVNVYAVGNPDTIGNPEVRPWEFTVRIFNRQGKAVQERTFRIAPGVIGSFEVAATDDLQADRLGRRTFRAEIVGFNPQPDPPGKYATTLEIYSLVTGHTSLLIGDPDILPAATIVAPPGAGN